MKTTRDNIINALAEIKKHREIDKIDMFRGRRLSSDNRNETERR